MTWGAIKRTTADALFSEYIREKAGWKCEWPYCGKDFSQNRQGLHNSHFHTRANPRVRFDESNVAAFCVHHHDHAGKHPHDHVEFFKKRLGEIEYDMLTVRANSRRTDRLDHKLEAIKWRAALRDLRKKTQSPIMGAKA